MKKVFIFIFLLFILVPLFSKITFNHEQPLNLTNGQRIILDLEIREGFSDVEKVTIFFRQIAETAYSEKEMEAGSESNPYYSSVMSEFTGYSLTAEYYFEVKTKAGNIITYPSIQPEMNPLRITVYTPQIENDGFVLLSPDAAFSDVTDNFLIAISIFAISDEIEHNSIQVFFDGKDVTSESRIFTNALTYQVSNVKPGDHSYYVKAKLLNGSTIESEHWITSITERGFDLPLDLSGRALLSMRYMNTSHDTLDDLDKSANFLINFKGSHKWLRFKSKLYLSSLETSSTQAVNKYSLAFHVPHFDLTIGDHAPRMNSFLLSCKNVQGIHTKLDFKSFRLMYTRGNLKRSVDGKVVQDTLIHSGTFKQKNSSVRLELGNPQSFIMGFGFAKNKDDIGSLDEQYYRNLDDSLLVVAPKDNLVFGTDFRLSLMNQRLVIGTEAAMSLYNDNIIDGAICSDDSLDYDLPFDPQDFENIFVINESMIPFKPGMASIALKSYLRLFLYRNLLNISFTNIGSSFNSLSTNYLQKDAMIISFNDNLMLMNNRLALNFGFNLASDNVDDTKDNTSTSTAIFTQAMYKPNDEMYFNINFNTSGSEDGFVPDSTDFENTAIDIRSTSISFGTGYLVKQISNAPTRLSLNFSNSLNKDNANNSFEYKRNNITLSAKTEFEQLPLTTLLSFTFTLNDNSYQIVESDTTFTMKEASNYNSIFLRGEVDLIDGQLKPYLDFRYNLFSGDIDSQTAQMFNIGSSYEITTNSFITAGAGLKLYQNSDASDSDYSRLNFKMKISQKF
ncbi:MAG: hypothetical protein U9P73_01080 [Candidatus Cloacimonadota bacterium]|nr:hypothetical protein [Candidatus Cloacimonadota bacterium]